MRVIVAMIVAGMAVWRLDRVNRDLASTLTDKRD